jgi:hypothetical protein
MARRKKTDIVQFKLRIREVLRKRLETVAKNEERSLNSEIVDRLEQSFAQNKNMLLLEAILAPGLGLDLIRAVATIITVAGPEWHQPPKSHAVADAINKVVAVFTGELPANRESFPDHDETGTGDNFAWAAMLVARIFAKGEIELKGAAQ